MINKVFFVINFTNGICYLDMSNANFKLGYNARTDRGALELNHYAFIPLEQFKTAEPLNIMDQCLIIHLGGVMMETENDKKLASFLKDEEVKVVWKEDDKTKVGRGKIMNDDDNFIYLTGTKGTVIVSKTDVIAIKQ